MSERDVLNRLMTFSTQRRREAERQGKELLWSAHVLYDDFGPVIGKTQISFDLVKSQWTDHERSLRYECNRPCLFYGLSDSFS